MGKIDVATAYGAALPTGTWANVHIRFGDLSNTSGISDTTHFDNVVLRTYHGAGNTYFFVDDVALTGADIFKDGFER